ncbi:MAG: uroporphyrinogen-III synthase [Acidobacteriota bacterium]|nr:uroporphyrinogen-III synthase [Acidobacteriota bacterium]MDQ5873261.1 uroporphyrinogen-III synthase [Acidobacteriota bacterium]
MKPRLLVLRSGERPFPADLVPELDLLEERTHDFESLEPDGPVGDFDLVLFTSAPAVERFLARDQLTGRVGGRTAVHAVGPATAELLRRGGIATVYDGGGSVRSLLENFPERLAGTRVLLPRGEDADDELPRELAARGAAVVTLTLYRKTPVPYDAALDEEIASRPPAVLFATSSGAARWFFDGASPESARRLRGTPAVALGEPTEAALVSYNVERVEIARPPTFESAARLAVRLAAAASPA